MACASINEICIFPTYIEFVLSFEPFKYSFNQCCLLTANIACHENGIPKFLPVKLTVCQKKCPSKSKYIEYLYETIYYTLLSFASFQISYTRSHCISSMCGPFNETRIKSSKCSIFNRFLFISLMRFCLENPLSHHNIMFVEGNI